MKHLLYTFISLFFRIFQLCRRNSTHAACADIILALLLALLLAVFSVFSHLCRRNATHTACADIKFPGFVREKPGYRVLSVTVPPSVLFFLLFSPPSTSPTQIKHKKTLEAAQRPSIHSMVCVCVCVCVFVRAYILTCELCGCCSKAHQRHHVKPR